MSTLAERREFFRAIVLSRIEEPGPLLQLDPWCYKDTDKLRHWWNRFHREVPQGKFSLNPRLVNHFALGADPEFVFVQKGIGFKPGGVRANAMDLKLKAGRAYGADNNGRLVEIRPFPSKSALQVLASMHTTMRWMYILEVASRNCTWQAGAYLFEDGLGGHVHFGTKRKKAWGTQVEGLDAIENVCEALRVYPVEECLDRRGGDAHHQVYGRFGDIRAQKHGYEYRTFPSWLSTPWLAYFSLVLAKLAVHDPEICAALQTARQIEGVLRYYAPLDDDARLALRALRLFGLPVHLPGDFRIHWGLQGYKSNAVAMPVTYVPAAIPPDPANVKELWGYFDHEEKLQNGKIPEITWAPTNPPVGFKLCLDEVDTRVQKGLGELICDLVRPDESKILLTSGGKEGQTNLLIGTGTKARFDLLPAGSWRLTGNVQKDTVAIPLPFREGKAAKVTKKLLLSGAFPLWRIQDATREKWEAWKNSVFLEKDINRPVRVKAIGKIILEVGV